MVRSKKELERLTIKDESIENDSAICLKDISFGYEENTLNVKNISFDIKKGESVAFIGHNGSGKSTIAKLIDGILVQKQGDIFIFGVKMTDDNALILRKDIGLVFQNPDAQFIGATVKDDIAFGLENNCIEPEKMNDIILDCATKVGMEDYLESEPTSLSGGQKQRVAIAGAIARNPKILILDEAGAMLDPKGKRQIREIIKQRKKENPDLTIINITHEIDDAYDSDRVIVLNHGEIVFDGKPSVAFTDDELLNKVNLDIPFAHKLAKELNNLGYKVPSINNDEELYNYLCQSK